MKCLDCKWFDPYDKDGTNGVCRRFPPTWAGIAQHKSLVGGGVSQSHIYRFPEIRGEAYCGEYSARLAVAGE